MNRPVPTSDISAMASQESTGRSSAPVHYRPQDRRSRTISLSARGEPMVWLTGAALGTATLMITGLLLLILFQGTATFWPKPLVQVTMRDGGVFLGEITRSESYRLDEGEISRLSPDMTTLIQGNSGMAKRNLLRVGNYDIYGEDFRWIPFHEIRETQSPDHAVMIERMEWGPFVGYVDEILVEGQSVAKGNEAYRRLVDLHPKARALHSQLKTLEKSELGDINHEMEALRLKARTVELKHGESAPEHQRILEQNKVREEELRKEYDRISESIQKLRVEDERVQVVLREVGGTNKVLSMSQIVRFYLANQMTFWEKIKIYLNRWREFITDEPREANTEGGVFPAIFGTVMMTLLMSIMVTPFGIIAAIYLREYARHGFLVSAIRIAVNNLAGVPSIVFGVFGLGFFCYILGVGIDQWFFAERLPNPTFGTTGILWASLTLALLTVPVVIVSTEEAIAAVPRSIREGSYACGASRWQTIARIILPRATPGIMTGFILAMARGAGEVAPLMITGVVKIAPALPIDHHFPYFHLERTFMHLGFHIYDVGFQSRNAEAGKPMVFTTTLLLILVILVLNISAIYLRGRLKRRYISGQF